MNILILDDSKMVRHIVCNALKELGYNDVFEAANVAEAKNILGGRKYGLIISDWHMPGQTGLDFLKFIRSKPEYAKLPFILQTTESEKKNIVEAVKAGVSGYLLKPIEKKALAAKLADLAKIHDFQPPYTFIPAAVVKQAAPPPPTEAKKEEKKETPGEPVK